MKPEVCCLMANGPIADTLRFDSLEHSNIYSKNYSLLITDLETIPFGCKIYVCPWHMVSDFGKSSEFLRSSIIAYGPVKYLSLATDAGAADYMREPWELEELDYRAMRIIGKNCFDFSWGSVFADGKESRINGLTLSLARGRHQFFELLACNAGKVLSHECILRALHINNTRSRILSVYASELRQQIAGFVGTEAEHILVSCYGSGYFLKA